jgi:hypothetical protein
LFFKKKKFNQGQISTNWAGVILATQEREVRRIEATGQHWQKQKTLRPYMKNN